MLHVFSLVSKVEKMFDAYVQLKEKRAVFVPKSLQC